MAYLAASSNLTPPNVDCVIFVNDSTDNLPLELETIQKALTCYKEFNPNLDKEVSVVPFPGQPAKRIIFSPTGALNTDISDNRNISEASGAGIQKAHSLNFRHPILVLGPLISLVRNNVQATNEFSIQLSAVLGACYKAYVPLEIREDKPAQGSKLDKLYVYMASEKLVAKAAAIEEGRQVARDIHGSDPERMAPPQCAQYLLKEFESAGDVVKIEVHPVKPSEHPLMAAVDRAASVIERHQGKVVRLNYAASDFDADKDETLYLVGKGITYDTGGADIKHGGNMAGMHRDKGGAAAIGGLFKTLAVLRPPHLRVVGMCAFVRNSVGENAYVADEIITSRAGKRVRVGNTDAEGRMVMADLLCEAKEMALNDKNPRLFTLATLTGHVIRAFGPNYTGVMCNGKGRELNIPQSLILAGDCYAEPLELSTIRREDFAFHKGQTEYEDVLQSNNLPSTLTARGHQSPAAFLQLASGISECGLDSAFPLAYTHLDIAGSSGMMGTTPTGAPMLALLGHYVLPKLH